MPDSQFGLCPVSRHADDNVILRNVSAQRLMKHVPPAEDCSPIRVGLSLHDRVVDAMHTRRYDYLIQTLLKPKGKTPVGMMKQSNGLE